MRGRKGYDMIQDSGKRREFVSGAVRDVDDGKGRCDLLPLKEVGDALNCEAIVHVGEFMESGDMDILNDIITHTAENLFGDKHTAMLEVAMHYAEGAKKYEERNWEKGIDCHCYVDSYVRHTIKYLRGDKDERHDRAMLWNLLGLKWTIRNKPEYNDLPYVVPNDETKTETGETIEVVCGDKVRTITYKVELGDVGDI